MNGGRSLTQKKLSQVIYIALLVCCVFVMGYLLGKNGKGREVRVSVAQVQEEIGEVAAQIPDDTVTGAIDLNTATKEQLVLLPKIGEVLAQRIIDYRDSVGGFSSKEELKNVSGIGNKIYEGLKDLVTVGGSS